MKNLKERLKDYLERFGKGPNTSYREIYDAYPFDGNDLTNKQKGDRVRSIWKRLKKEHKVISSYRELKDKYPNIPRKEYNAVDYEWVTTASYETGLDNPTKEEYNQYMTNKPYYNNKAPKVSSELPELTLDSSSIIKKESELNSQVSKVYAMSSKTLPEIVMEPEGYNKYQPEEDGNYLILGCVHAPFVNKPFWDALCKYALRNRHHIKGIILNGDFLDLNSLSSHDRGRMPLEGVSIGWEYKESQKLLKQLTDNLLPDTYHAYLYGNHEDRQKRYMSTPDGQKLKGGVLTPEEGLQLSTDWNVFTDWKNDEIQLGDLSIIHGEFFSVHLCKKYLDTFRKNMLFAHSHRQQLYREGSSVAYNIGCMLDINSPVFSYASKAMKQSWANGFALATLNNGKTNVQLVTWNEDHFLIGNEKYK